MMHISLFPVASGLNPVPISLVMQTGHRSSLSTDPPLIPHITDSTHLSKVVYLSPSPLPEGPRCNKD